MKRASLYFVLFLALLGTSVAEEAKGADEAKKKLVLSEQELRSAIDMLSDSRTEAAAMQRLIEFADILLYGGSVIVIGDPATDELRRQAARALHAHRSVDSIKRAILSDDRDVRYWGVMSFPSNDYHNLANESWKRLLPSMQALAADDEDEGIRSRAIETLQNYPETAPFLKELRESGNEKHPWVLMKLLKFDQRIPEMRAQWYAQAKTHLAGKDEALRMLWLKTVWGNVCIPHTGVMWKLEADPGMMESLRTIEQTGSKEEKDLAGPALKALSAKR